jgi:hypothetical protein
MLGNWGYKQRCRFFIFHGRIAPVGQGLLSIEASRSNSNTTHSVGFLWTSDQSDSETSTWHNIPATRDRHLCLRQDSNSHSQQATATAPRLIPRGQWDWHTVTISNTYRFSTAKIIMRECHNITFKSTTCCAFFTLKHCKICRNLERWKTNSNMENGVAFESSGCFWEKALIYALKSFP